MTMTTDYSDDIHLTKRDEQRNVFRLRREVLEDRFIHLRDDLMALKSHSRKQEDKIKRMTTKLIHLLNEKERMGHCNDNETEELIAKMQRRIRDLYRENEELKAKLSCLETKYTKDTSMKTLKLLPKSDFFLADDANSKFWQFIYWLVFTLAFLVIYKFFLSNLCNYLVEYYLYEYIN